jgi:uncharacterized membrane protein YozB (DUF420 family)
MDYDIKILANINFIVQMLLIITVIVAAFLAKVKRQTIRHCTIMRIAVFIQILTIAIVMIPSMLRASGYQLPSLLRLELTIHGILGLVVVALWIYINIVFKMIKDPARIILPMRLALVSWLVSFILGLHIYLSF